MQGNDDIWGPLRGHARCYLRRFADPWTRSHCDDLVQETAVTAWHWAAGLHDPRCLWGAVRTIARRARGRALIELQRERDAREAFAVACLDRAAGADRCFRIAGRRVSLRGVWPCVERALRRLPAMDRRLVLDFHDGFSCAELALRCDRSEAAVKTRIHRARRRLQKEIEACVRAADDLEVLLTENRDELEDEGEP